MYHSTLRSAQTGEDLESSVIPEGTAHSVNRAAGPALSPWVARLYATRMDLPDGLAIDCGLVADTASIRVMLHGSSSATTRDGDEDYGRSVLLFGSQSRRMPVTVRGRFAAVGIAFRPGACHVLGGPSAGTVIDRVVPFEDLGGDSEELLAKFDPDGEPDEWLDTLERDMIPRIAKRGARAPEAVTSAFDLAAFENPNQKIGDIADQLECSKRRLERIVRRYFGMSPKQVLRRARALDMAAALRGVADAEEADAVALRYYDQSHLTRDFIDFFGMTPMQFVQRPQPLMTNTLEIRQARRLEELDRMRPGDAYPWRQTAA
jgi:AraC-like DNA-binding protein